MAQGRPEDGRPVFPMPDGRHWSEAAYRNWRRKIFNPAARAIRVTRPRPYDLRHSFASLLFAEGANPVEIAEQMGHSLAMLLGT